MGISERKEREKQEMRRRILDVAMNMFLVDGYEKTSLRNIAEKIEYSPATIYLYFKDKDELFYEVQKDAFQKLNEVFAQHVTATEPLARLRQICHTYVQFGIANPELYDLMFIIRAPMNVVEEKEMWDNGTDAFDFLVQTLTACIEQKLIKYTDPMIAALSVWSMGHGLISLNVRCRIKVMQMCDEDVANSINLSIEEFLRVISTP
ncbi:MAG TPA: TetR/AcrR family transcriptional regulator [Flavipsychrobacter sp.]|nr:TetR/AcrR family transcriptional regulator [Chitinophagales bacterium]HLO69598.1 TetR/AcrR family transcriptional regulator [Flavipsychrobacter sp.]